MNNLTRKEREKLQRQREIIDAAEKIFARDGFEHASMNEIAKESEFTKRTLYQYFIDKSDLYLAVALRLYNEMYDSLKTMELTQKNGLDKIIAIFLSYYEFYKMNESKFRIIYDIGNVRKESENPKILEFLKIDQLMFQKLEELIIEGQEDGSISKRLNAKSTNISLMFMFTGFLNQLTIAGRNFTKHLDITLDDLSSYVLLLIKSALK